jgi:ribosomal protein L37E
VNRTDPYEPPGEYHYECRECGGRSWSDERLGACPECGGAVENLAVPRE